MRKREEGRGKREEDDAVRGAPESNYGQEKDNTTTFSLRAACYFAITDVRATDACPPA